MGLFDKVAGWLGYNRIGAATQRDHDGWFVRWAQGGGPTTSGEIVNNSSAFQLATVFACIRAISEDVAKVPLKVFRADGEIRVPQPTHIVQRLLTIAPNDDMAAISFRNSLTAHCLGWGNGYAEIIRDRLGVVVALNLLRPDRVRPVRQDDGSLEYEVTTDAGPIKKVPSNWMFHVPGFGFDGLVGYNVIRFAREALGAAIATQKTAAAFFGNAMSPDGILTHPGNLSEPAQDRLEKTMDRKHGGAAKTKRLMILEEGMTYTPTTIPPEEAQFLETRQFTVPEICRWFRMQPHKVADLQKATFSNIEHQALEYVGDTLTSWMIRWEQEISRKLFTEQELSQGFYAKHIADALLRGDIATRFKAYSVGRQWGWLSVDDVRRLEDMNPLEEGGDIYLTPLNMADVTDPPPNNTATELNAEIASRLANAEIHAIEARIDKADEDKERFNAWVEDYFNHHAKYIRKSIEALGLDTEAIVDQLVREGIEAFTGNHEDAMNAWQESRVESISTLLKESGDA